MSPVDNKSLVSLTASQDLPQALTPKPISTETKVVEPPLPSVVSKATPLFDGRNRFISSAPPLKPNGKPKDPAHSLKILAIMIIIMVVLLATIAICSIAVTILAFVSRWACPRLRECLEGFDI
ncbi:hypothetical protein Vadar_022713 [Vaccinium darrowii]|uniref:Uncharacterized protein n=1 Tax=Vaccinium darrowii TaxID=229202 RepID=A0ACB7XKH9_9ERIC|nr:hypothetical protein Vadar_022713 [Vaccinium darrowii]